jgi:hypothetical protein
MVGVPLVRFVVRQGPGVGVVLYVPRDHVCLCMWSESTHMPCDSESGGILAGCMLFSGQYKGLWAGIVVAEPSLCLRAMGGWTTVMKIITNVVGRVFRALGARNMPVWSLCQVAGTGGALSGWARLSGTCHSAERSLIAGLEGVSRAYQNQDIENQSRGEQQCV